jgi:hypothetical protein
MMTIPGIEKWAKENMKMVDSLQKFTQDATKGFTEEQKKQFDEEMKGVDFSEVQNGIKEVNKAMENLKSKL